MAGNTGAIRAGKAVVEIWADKTPLQKGLNSAKASLASWGKSFGAVGASIAGIGAAIRAPILAATAAFAEAGSANLDLSQRTGLSTEAVSRLGFAARQTGAGIEDVEVGVKKMQKFLSEAAHGSSEAKSALTELGISFTSLKGLKPEDQFAIISRSIAKLQDPMARSAAAMKIFGKSGTNLIPLMLDFDGLDARARRLGLGMSLESAQAAHALGDSFEDLKTISKGLTVSLGAALAPSLRQWTDYSVLAVKAAKDWIKANQGTVVIAATVGSVLIAAGTAIAGIGTAFYIASLAVGGLSSAVAMMGAAWTGLIGILGAVKIAAIATWGALGGPLTIIVAALAVAGAAWLYFSGAGTAAIESLKGLVGTLAADFKAAFGAISNALAAGDIGAAVGVLWATLKLEWQRGVNALMGYWNAFKGVFLGAVNATFYGAVSIINNLWAGVETIFVSVVNSLFNAWGQLTGFLQKTWNSTIGFIQVAWLRFKNMFKKDVNIEAKVKAVNDQTTEANKAVDANTSKKVEQNNEGAASRQAQIERDRAGADAELQKALADKDSAMTEANRKAIQESEAALQKAKDEFKASVDKANSTKPADFKNPPPNPGVNVPTLDQQGYKLSASGTFSAFGGQGLAGGAMDRTAKATEQTAKNTADIKKKTKPPEVARLK